MFSFRLFLQSLRHACDGVLYAFQHEQNFRIHTIIGVLVILVAWVVHLDLLRWIVLLLMIFSVILMELLNTVFEKVVDILKPRLHPYARIVKDLMAGAVLLTALVSVIVGVLIFWGPILRLFS